jgi:ligand-binding SRPBCC domain-containing protein
VIEAVDLTTTVAADAATVWRRATSPEGINHELGPWLRMTMPRALRGATIDDVEVGVPAGRSWILLLGVVPVDYDDLTLAELEPGHRFLETSRLLSMRAWRHERVVAPAGEGACTVTDRIAFELRRPLALVPGSARLATAILRRLFDHRHRRLTTWFTPPTPN